VKFTLRNLSIVITDADAELELSLEQRNLRALYDIGKEAIIKLKEKKPR
jgi:hypothetical protein